MDFPRCFPTKGAWLRIALIVVGGILLGSCRTTPLQPAAGPPTGDEIVVAGQRFRTGTRVVTWLEPGGYNAYRGDLRFELRESSELSAPQIARVKDRGWDLAALRKVIDQFVLHYDAEGLSRRCFEVLQKRPGLSVHFLLDVDGTVYQTLDLQERAAHATTSNSRSIGIEIANIGAYPLSEAAILDAWYRRDAPGGTVITVPKRIRDPGIRTPNFIGRPARLMPVRGTVHGEELVQYDFTPEQYAALAKLTAALCRVFPRLTCEAPRDAAGRVVAQKLPDAELAEHRGIIGHFHIQENKVDPGPAFQWEAFLEATRRQLR